MATKGKVTTAKVKTEETKPEEIQEATEVVKEIPSTPPPIIVDRADKLVPMIPNFSGTKFIAGTWYEFTKGVEIKVPVHVKMLLKQSKAIEI